MGERQVVPPDPGPSQTLKSSRIRYLVPMLAHPGALGRHFAANMTQHYPHIAKDSPSWSQHRHLKRTFFDFRAILDLQTFKKTFKNIWFLKVFRYAASQLKSIKNVTQIDVKASNFEPRMPS